MKYDPSVSTNENLARAGYATGQSAGLHRRVYSLRTLRTVGTMRPQEINQWLAFGAPLDEGGAALDLPRTAEGPCMPPGQELVHVGGSMLYVEEAA